MNLPVTSQGWRVLTLSIASLASGIALGYREFTALGIAGLAAWFTALLWVILPADLFIERTVTPQRVTRSFNADESLAVARLAIRNLRPRSSMPVVARDHVAGRTIDVLVPRLGGGESWEHDEELPTHHRGVFAIGPMVVRRSDPFGIAARERAQGEIELLFVHPRRHQLSLLPAALLQSIDGPVTDNSARGSQVFQTIREYEPGDDRRFIHWPSTAKSATGSYFVRQFVDTNEPELTVLVDTWEGRQSPGSFEESIEVAASIVERCLNLRFPVTLDGLGEAPMTGRGESMMGTVLDVLAAATTSPNDNLLEIAERLTKVGRGTSIIIVTAALNQESAAELLQLGSVYRSLTVIDLDPDRSEIQASLPGVIYVPLAEASSLDGAWRALVGNP